MHVQVQPVANAIEGRWSSRNPELRALYYVSTPSVREAQDLANALCERLSLPLVNVSFNSRRKRVLGFYRIDRVGGAMRYSIVLSRPNLATLVHEIAHHVDFVRVLGERGWPRRWRAHRPDFFRFMREVGALLFEIAPELRKLEAPAKGASVPVAPAPVAYAARRAPAKPTAPAPSLSSFELTAGFALALRAALLEDPTVSPMTCSIATRTLPASASSAKIRVQLTPLGRSVFVNEVLPAAITYWARKANGSDPVPATRMRSARVLREKILAACAA